MLPLERAQEVDGFREVEGSREVDGQGTKLGEVIPREERAHLE